MQRSPNVGIFMKNGSNNGKGLPSGQNRRQTLLLYPVFFAAAACKRNTLHRCRARDFTEYGGSVSLSFARSASRRAGDTKLVPVFGNGAPGDGAAALCHHGA